MKIYFYVYENPFFNIENSFYGYENQFFNIENSIYVYENTLLRIRKFVLRIRKMGFQY